MAAEQSARHSPAGSASSKRVASEQHPGAPPIGDVEAAAAAGLPAPDDDIPF
jgi:hypothetical protein